MRKPKILIVDDDPDLLKALRLRLRANNCDVIACRTAIPSWERPRRNDQT
jgi:DNA-binding response OmpR family regulator